MRGITAGVGHVITARSRMGCRHVLGKTKHSRSPWVTLLFRGDQPGLELRDLKHSVHAVLGGNEQAHQRDLLPQGEEHLYPQFVPTSATWAARQRLCL